MYWERYSLASPTEGSEMQKSMIEKSTLVTSARRKIVKRMIGAICLL